MARKNKPTTLLKQIRSKAEEGGILVSLESLLQNTDEPTKEKAREILNQAISGLGGESEDNEE